MKKGFCGRWFKILFLAAILLVTVQAFVSHAQPMLTLNDALKIALENNYSIQLARNDADIAKNNNHPGNAGMLPVVTGTGLQDNSSNDTRQRFLDGRENNVSSAKSSLLTANLELGWTVFDGFRMFAAKNRLKELQEIGELRWRMQVEQTFLRVIRAYYDVVQTKQLMSLSRETVKLSEERMKLARDRFSAGKASKTEELQAQVDLNTDKSLLMRQENQLKNTKITFNQLLARDIQLDFDVPDTIETTPGLLLDETLNKARSRNTTILIAKKNQQVSSFILNEIRAERMPVIQLRTGYNYNLQQSQAGFLQYSQANGYHYGAGLSMNVFNGFNVQKRIQNASIGVRSSDLVLKDTISRVEAGVQQAYNSYVMSGELLKFELSNNQVAKSNFEIASEQYRLGVITPIELRQAQQNLLQSQSRLSTAQYESRLAETELIRLSGDLLNVK